MIAFEKQTKFEADVQAELSKARSKHSGSLRSRHEGLAILQEEVFEVQTNVYTDASAADLYAELVQVAAMAQRMAEDLSL